MEYLVFFGGLFIFLTQAVALIIGVRNFKNWFIKGVIEPYIKPIKEELEHVTTAQRSIKTEAAEQFEAFSTDILGLKNEIKVARSEAAEEYMILRERVTRAETLLEVYGLGRKENSS